MNLSDSQPVLVAPRPVRLAQPSCAVATRTAHTAGVKLNENTSVADFTLSLFSEPPPESDQLPPRASPRSALPSEALEEFLSILRPSFFPPASPIRRNRRQGVASLPVYAHDRSVAYHSRGLLDIMPSKDDVPDSQEMSQSPQPSQNATYSCTPEPSHELDVPKGAETEYPPFRWFKANILSSPISRNHTRNPFSRHLSNASPCSPAPRLSPAAIPLPLPTADEVL